MADKLVIVVGAGASAEFKLPIGSQLADQVSDSANTIQIYGEAHKQNIDPHLFSAAKLIGSESGDADFIEELRRISSGVRLMPSIDNYLHAHSHNEVRVKLGKLLIADALIKAERRSSLYFNPPKTHETFNFANVADTWLAALFRAIVTAGKIEQLESWLERITFVSFNYDRVIFRFFFLAVQAVFDLSEEEASKFCEKHLKVLHPYGSLGRLQPRNRESGFGENNHHQALLSSVNNIKVFTEGGERQTRQLVRQAILEAGSIWFLGFSFLDLNMKFLKPADQTYLKVFGTLRGMSDFNSRIARKELASWIRNGSAYEPGFDLVRTDCSILLNDFSGFFRSN
ncbi:hypothetical protein [Ruegeria atlantica]|uniref:hypothetical protein n=1 Tax=Ruegeria atlantica TaxID=81569 RepID=UPI00147EB7F2|nr:hypothetical protein [Ruegeria atlantica]